MEVNVINILTTILLCAVMIQLFNVMCVYINIYIYIYICIYFIYIYIFDRKWTGLTLLR